MELDPQSVLALLGLLVHSCTHWLRSPQQPPPLPRIWAHMRGRYWSAKIDDLNKDDIVYLGRFFHSLLVLCYEEDSIESGVDLGAQPLLLPPTLTLLLLLLLVG
jgi:hypothetical protein